MDKRRVVITGIGLITPLGWETYKVWNSILKGESGIDKITLFDASNFPVRFAGEVKDWDPGKWIEPREARRMDRVVQFSIAAAIEAVKDAGLDISKEDPFRVGVVIGTGIGGLTEIEEQHRRYLQKGPQKISPFLVPKMMPNAPSAQVSIYFKVAGPNFDVSTACASGTHAIGEAFKIIQRGDAEIIIAGGSESTVTPLGIGGFCALKALSTRNDAPQKASRPFDKNRDGFVLSEGCGILVLEELDHALNRGANIYAEIRGYGLSGEGYHITAPNPDGSGCVNAMKRAIEDAGIEKTEVQYINAHGTSTPYNDKVETLAIKKLFGEYAYNLYVSSTKSQIGHTLGASGAIELCFCVLTICTGKVPPTINYETPDPDCDLNYVPNNYIEREIEVCLSNSLGFGGHNASILISKYKPTY